MDVEERIGRIHRYGQNHTAQVYNLVLSDTIEGRIFLMLEEKLVEIAKTVGKVDEQGNVAEDLRAQILGQLSERLNYDRLYQEALSDPEHKRTRVELEAALSNAREARVVVFDLFQDLEGVSLDDYKPFSDVSSSLDRLVQFMTAAVADRQQRLVKVDDEAYDLVTFDGVRKARFTLNRETATSNDNVELMGLDQTCARRAWAMAYHAARRSWNSCCGRRRRPSPAVVLDGRDLWQVRRAPRSGSANCGQARRHTGACGGAAM